MDDKGLIEALGGLPTGNLCNAHPGVKAMHAAIKPLFPGAKLAGPARTAITAPGQNAAIHRALVNAKPGDVLVVDGGGSRLYGPFGDILATACQLKGITGLVIDSSVRDLAEIRDLGFAVFCLGTNPSATQKTDLGEIDVPVVCAGVRVSPGDYVVGDEDGVVVIPQDIAQKVAEAATAVARREADIRAALAKGKSTCEIFDIPQSDPLKTYGRPPMINDQLFFNLDDMSQGIARELAPGVNTRIFAGDQAMLSIVMLAPHAEGSLHSHPEEQWGVMLEGDGVRVQNGEEVAVKAGDFWRTPGDVLHSLKAGASGARVLDIFSPPREEYRKAVEI